MSIPCSLLIVEDERIIREGLLSFPWVDLGFVSVRGASDGAEALEILEKKPVDLIITDVRMPEVDGLSLCRTVRDRWPQTKTVILTGYRDFDFVRDALKSKVLEYLLKPVDLAELEATVRRLKGEIDEERRLSDAPPHKPKAFAVVRAGTFDSKEPSVLQAMLSRAFGNRLAGQTFSGSDIILFMAEILTVDELRSTLTAEFEAWQPPPEVHAAQGTSIREALNALDAAFYADQGSGVRVWEGTPVSLPQARKEESFLVQVCLDGRPEDVSSALDALAKAWNLDLHPSPSELKDRLKSLADQVLAVLDRHVQASRIPPVETLAQIQKFPLLWTQTETLFLKAAEAVREVNSGSHASARWAVLQAIRHIEEHASEPLSLVELATMSRLNPSYFSSQFKKEVGMNYIDYIKKVRIAKASKLLQNSDLKVYEVASSVGYTDTKYFSEVFKEITGITPLAYRQKIVVS